MLNLDQHYQSAQRELCKRSLYQFFKTMWPIIEHSNPFIDSNHVEFICNEIQPALLDLANGVEKKRDILINVPPRHLKSTIVSVMAPVWIWLHNPSLDIIVGSHSSDLSTKLTMASRDILRSNKFRSLFPDITLKEDNDRKTEYSNTKGGTRIGATPGRDVTGQNADIIIIDDPIGVKTSQNVIDRANEWITSQLFNRKNDQRTSLVLTIMQRISETDPSGMLLELDPSIYHICLPIEETDKVKPPKARDLYVNGLLDNERFPLEVIKGLQARPIQYENMWLQNPSPKGGGYVKEEWLPIQDKTPQLYSQLNNVPPHFFIDSAYTENTSNDPSGIIVVKELNKQLYIIKSELVWMGFPDLVKYLNTMVLEHGYTNQSKIYIEQKASGISLTQQLKRETNLNVVEDETLKTLKGSKADRLQAISPQLESKRVYLIRGNWNKGFIDQLTTLKPTHDEYWDTTVMAIQNLLLNQNKGTGEYAVRRAKSRS